GRAARMRLSDTGLWTNQNLSYARAVQDMLLLADAMIEGGILRKESRGSHYRSDYPQRNDEQFLKSTVAKFDAAIARPVITFENVQLGLSAPRLRNYSKAGLNP
ncbi:MAG: succinate dehydrogenase flavoprotein subunit, partial [Phycisphaerae bacterium]|nr:succinate dehydrogenase flavoprotein subunit [Phycisphaerae bacterium]